MTTASEISPSTDPLSPRGTIRFGLVLALLGFVIFVFGLKPQWFDPSYKAEIGVWHIFFLLLGLAILCLGGYISVSNLWAGHEKTIAADIGARIIATGFLIAAFSGMADLLGMGAAAHTRSAPFFGPWQVRGVEFGIVVIAIGFLMMIPYGLNRKSG
jgi:hypothetical protein